MEHLSISVLKENEVFALSIRLLIAALVIAIVLQNTCPHGWAAKSAFVSSHVFHCCSLNEHKHSGRERREDGGKELSHVNPAFVFHVSNSVTVVQDTASLCFDIPFVFDTIGEVFLDRFLKPPTSHLFA